MSTATVSPTERGLPTPVSNLLTSWWLAIGFAAVAAFLMWPDLPWGRLTILGYVLLFAGIGVMVAIGSWVGFGLGRGDPAALARCRLFSLLGTLAGLAVIIGGIAFKAMAKTPEGAEPALSYTGATNLFLVGSLLAALLMPPLLFGLFTWSLSMQDEVERHFNPPALVDEQSQVSMGESLGEEVNTGEIVTVESEPVIVDNSSVGTLMAEEDEAVEQALASQEADLLEQASTSETLAVDDDLVLATPAAEPFDTGSVNIEGGSTESGSTDPFATTSATGKRLKQMAKDAQRLDPSAIDGSVVEAVEASEVLSATDVSESVSAEMADEGSESVLLADEDVSALLASAVEEKPHSPKSERLPPIPSNLDEPLSVGDLELTFDDSPPDKK